MDDAGSNPVTETELKRLAYNAYMRVYLKRRYRERISEAIAQLGGSCAFCGSCSNLEFDHINRSTKKLEITVALYKRKRNDPELVEEIEKCQLLCRPCHETKTQEESTVGHGGGLTGVRNCRCELCGPLKKSYMQPYNKGRCRKRNCSCEKKHYA